MDLEIYIVVRGGDCYLCCFLSKVGSLYFIECIDYIENGNVINRILKIFIIRFRY